MKKLTLSIVAILAAVSAQADFVITHADGTAGASNTTLVNAIKAATDGDVIKLTANSQAPANSRALTVFNRGGLTLTLDLAGYSITRPQGDSSNSFPCFTVSAGTVILTDSSTTKSGKLDPFQKNTRSAIVLSGGKLIVEAGTIVSGDVASIQVTGGELEIKGGTLTGSKPLIKPTVATAKIAVSGGSFTGSAVNAIEPVEGLTVDISGGQFAIPVGAKIGNLTGGLFANKDDERLEVNADSATKDAYPWTGSTAVTDPICRVVNSGREYATIQDVNGNLAEGDVIELLKDVSDGGSFVVNEAISVTFDLNGFNFTTSESSAFTVGKEGATLTLRNGKETGKIVSGSKNGVVSATRGTLILENVDIENVGGFTGVRADGFEGVPCQVTIQGGTIIGGSSEGTVSYAVSLVGTDTSLTILGGTISSSKRGVRVASGNQLLISGGLIEAPIGVQTDAGYKTPFIMLSGGTIRSSTTALYIQEGTSSIIMNGATLESPEMAIKVGTASSLLSVCSGAIKSKTICDVAEENADEYRKFITGGYYTIKPATGYIKKGYQAIANPDENAAEYPWEVVAKATTEETGVTEIKLPDSFTGALTIPATMNAVKVPANMTLKVLGSSGAEITGYVTTAADTEGVIKIDLDPKKVVEPTMNEAKFEGEEEGIAIPESVEGLTYQLLGGTSLDQIVDIHDEKTGTGEKLEFTPDASKLKGATSAFFRVRVVK